MQRKHEDWIKWLKDIWRDLPLEQYGPVHDRINLVLTDLRSGTRRRSRTMDRLVVRHIRNELAKKLPSGHPSTWKNVQESTYYPSPSYRLR